MERDKVISTAASLYADYGIKGVCMSRIASELSVSKRTIYQEFENKEQLLQECMIYAMQKLSDSVAEVQSSSKSALEAILYTCTEVLMFYSSFCPAFHRDLHSFPEAHRIWNRLWEALHEQCISNLRQGVAEGDVLPDQNYELISTMLIDQLRDLKPGNQVAMITTILRGICTNRGTDSLIGMIYSN